MDTSLTVNQNPILENTFLNSKWLNPGYLFNHGFDFLHNFFAFFVNNGSQIISIYNAVIFFFALFFLIIISYTVIRVMEIRKKEHKHLKHELEEYAHHQKEHEEKMQEKQNVSKNERWVKTLEYVFSSNSGDWKLAIIEADSMLDSLMSQLGFKGETLGDKLKGATQESFHSLSAAWAAHTVRNRIAHEGGAFELSQHEAKRIIALYEQIFREFGYI